MIIPAIAFYLFAAVTIISGLMVVTSRNPVHSVLWLILAFFNSAGFDRVHISTCLLAWALTLRVFQRVKGLGLRVSG